MNKNDRIVTEIVAMNSEGNGVARADGMAVFIPFSAVGDRGTVRIEKVLRSYAFGRFTEIEEPSPARQAADCPSYVRCGGCCFRHITYEEELIYKEQFVKDALKRIGGLDAEVQRIIPSPSVERYRNKIQFPVSQDEEGRLFPGFYSARSHRVVRTAEHCSLQPEIMNRIAVRACELLTASGASAYDEKTFKGLVRHILIRQSSVDGSVLMCIVVNSKEYSLPQTVVDSLISEFSCIKTIVTDHNCTRGNEILSSDCRTVWGNGYVKDEICGVPVRVTALSFFQINHASTELLYGTVKEMAELKAGEVLFDLYCGAGTIGLSASGPETELYGIEVIPDAVKSAEHAAEEMGRSGRSRFICGDSSEMKELSEKGIHPDVIITDPPRKGCSVEVLSNMVAATPERIVMVSCNAATLARDLKHLVENGYQVDRVQPFDMFPRTKHVESVVLMSRGG